MIKHASYSLLCLVVAATLLMAGSSCQNSANRGQAARNIPSRNPAARYHGIDISSHQGNIDWKKLTADKDLLFVYIKASEGATYSSQHYGFNLTMAHHYGLLVGSYHYLTTTSPIDRQMANFATHAPKGSQDLIPMLDVETRGSWTRSQLIDSVSKMAGLIERHYGVKPMIYSTMGFYNKNLAPHFNKYHLYIGRYSTQEPTINWEGSYTIWQFTENGILPGIEAYVDLCRMSDNAWLDDIVMPPLSTL